jgi:hypothetical protein
MFDAYAELGVGHLILEVGPKPFHRSVGWLRRVVPSLSGPIRDLDADRWIEAIDCEGSQTAQGIGRDPSPDEARTRLPASSSIRPRSALFVCSTRSSSSSSLMAGTFPRRAASVSMTRISSRVAIAAFMP